MSPHQLRRSSVSQIQNLPLSAPAHSACPANPHPLFILLHLLLCWPLSLSLSLSLSLVCLLLVSTPSPNTSLFLFLPLTLFFPSPTRSLLSFYPQSLFLLLRPCMLISFCLFSSPPPPLSPKSSRLLLSYFSPCHTCKLSPPLGSLLMSQSSPPLSRSSSVLVLHVGELTGAAGTTGRETEKTFCLSPFNPFQASTLLRKCAGDCTSDSSLSTHTAKIKDLASLKECMSPTAFHAGLFKPKVFMFRNESFILIGQTLKILLYCNIVAKRVCSKRLLVKC